MKNIIFLGRKKLSRDCLKYLYDMPDTNIMGVWTCPTTEKIWWDKRYVREYAEDRGIPIVSLDDILKFDNIDFIISVLCPKIIKQEVLDKAKIAAINIHTGPLPEYGGCYEAAWAIINEDKQFGVTLHLMTEDVDQGDIIEKRYFEISDTITGKELREKTLDYCFEVFKDNIRNILDNNFKVYPQNLKYNRIYSRDSLSNKEVDLEWPLKKIYNFVRALDFSPFEPAYIKYKNKKIYLRVGYK